MVTIGDVAGNEKDALAALASIGAVLYSLGQTATGGTTGEPNTFMFGFKAANGILTPPLAENPSNLPDPRWLALGQTRPLHSPRTGRAQ